MFRIEPALSNHLKLSNPPAIRCDVTNWQGIPSFRYDVGVKGRHWGMCPHLIQVRVGGVQVIANSYDGMATPEDWAMGSDNGMDDFSAVTRRPPAC